MFVSNTKQNLKSVWLFFKEISVHYLGKNTLHKNQTYTVKHRNFIYCQFDSNLIAFDSCPDNSSPSHTTVYNLKQTVDMSDGPKSRDFCRHLDCNAMQSNHYYQATGAEFKFTIFFSILLILRVICHINKDFIILDSNTVMQYFLPNAYYN